MDALKKCDNNPLVIISVAKLFEKDRKAAKARKWFERAVALDAKLGDAWAFLYAFELRQGAVSASASTSTSGSASGSASAAGPGDAEDSSIPVGSTSAATLLESVAHRCAAAEPNRGELWCQVAKDTKNRHTDIGTLLKLVVASIIDSESRA